MRLQLADYLHSADFRSSGKSSGREGIHEHFDRICTLVDNSADPADKMDDMAVILKLLQEIYAYIMAISGEVVSGEVNEHGMFRIFLRIIAESAGVLLVLDRIPRPCCRTCDRVDEGLSALDSAMGLR